MFLFVWRFAWFVLAEFSLFLMNVAKFHGLSKNTTTIRAHDQEGEWWARVIRDAEAFSAHTFLGTPTRNLSVQ